MKIINFTNEAIVITNNPKPIDIVVEER